NLALDSGRLGLASNAPLPHVHLTNLKSSAAHDARSTAMVSHQPSEVKDVAQDIVAAYSYGRMSLAEWLLDSSQGAAIPRARRPPASPPADSTGPRSPEWPSSSGRIASGFRFLFASVAAVMSARRRMLSPDPSHQYTLYGPSPSPDGPARTSSPFSNGARSRTPRPSPSGSMCNRASGELPSKSAFTEADRTGVRPFSREGPRKPARRRLPSTATPSMLTPLFSNRRSTNRFKVESAAMISRSFDDDRISCTSSVDAGWPTPGLRRMRTIWLLASILALIFSASIVGSSLWSLSRGCPCEPIT